MSGSSGDPGGWLPDYFARVRAQEDRKLREGVARRRVAGLVGVAVSAFGIFFGLTLLWLGMRTVMATEGGFVAVGGPYEIAHPAPGWIWIMPVSVWIGMGFGALNAVSARWAEGFDLVVPAWSATFLSLGYNFADFGLGFRGGGLIWGWIICAVAFIPMGAIPLFWLGRGWSLPTSATWVRDSLISHDRKPSVTSRAVYVLLNVIAIPAGIFAAWAFFRAISG
jgi:hypothetical protein